MINGCKILRCESCCTRALPPRCECLSENYPNLFLKTWKGVLCSLIFYGSPSAQAVFLNRFLALFRLCRTCKACLSFFSPRSFGSPGERFCSCSCWLCLVLAWIYARSLLFLEKVFLRFLKFFIFILTNFFIKEVIL